MKLKFESYFRGLLIALFLLLGWSVWRAAAQDEPAAAATSTNAVTVHSTNAGATTEAELTKAFESPDWVKKLAHHWPFLRYHFWGNELWKYIFSFIYIFLAFYISKLLDYLTRVWLKKWTAKTETKLDDLLLDLLNGPVKIISFVIFLRIGLDVFAWPPIVQNILTKGFTIVVAFTITYAIMKLVDALMSYWHLRTPNNADQEFREHIFPIIRKTLKAFVAIIAVLMTLNNLGVNITAAIASLSIGGLAVGLAAQDTLANFFGAVSVFVDKPFKIGDRIQIDVVDGTVEQIGLRSTRVRSLDGYLVTIPNKTMNNAIITNVSRRPTIKTVMNIGLTYDTSAEKVKLALKIIEEIFRSNERTADLVVGFNQFADSALNIQVVHFWRGTDGKANLADLQLLNLKLKERFDAEGINFAFPSRTIYLKQDSAWQLGAKTAS